MLCRTLKFLSCLPYVLVCVTAAAQEICNNGIDDDGDGLIDCYDTDCYQNAACADFFYGKPPVSCQTVPTVTSFGLNTIWTSPMLASTRSTAMVADIDGDGVPEVICHKDAVNQLYVLNGVDGSIKLTISCPPINDVADAIAVADTDLDGFGEIYVVSNDAMLRCFEHTGVPKAGFTPANAVNVERAPALYDFNGDGMPEVLVGNRIFHSQTGALIAAGTGSAGINTGMNAAHPVAADVLPDAFCPDCAGLEMICGNHVYSVNIATGTVTIVATAPAGLGDGFTSVADMNMDGLPDVVVTNNAKLYIWDPRTGNQIGVTVTFSGRGGRPNIADFDGDGKPEIGIGALHQYWVFDDVAAGMNVLWSRTISDASAATTGTSFDFECDQVYEVVYRDEDSLYIWDGATGVNKASIWCGSATRTEYPTIVDVDADGQVNIVCICATAHQGGGGVVTAFNSNVNQWVSARKVMNQHSYFATNINDNLTVPSNQQNHALIPKLNSFLAQAPVYDVNWNSTCIPSPDLTVQIDSFNFNGCYSPNSTNIYYRVCNGGSSINPSTIYLSFYNGNPHAGGTLLDVDSITGYVFSGTCATTSSTIPFGGDFNLYVYVNDKATQPVLAPVILFKECDTLNNAATTVVSWAEPMLSISDLDSGYCPISITVPIVVSPVGGVLSGAGISGTSFNPQTAGIGNHTIAYAYGANNCVYDTSVTVQVYPLPEPNFLVDPVCYGEGSVFTNTSTISSGSIAQYQWNFGDAQSSTAPAPSHNYSAPGTYSVTLVAVSDKGCVDSVTDNGIVHPKPIAGFSVPAVCFGGTSVFTDSSTVSAGSVVLYNWNFSDGNTASSSSPTNTYLSYGNYDVHLIVETDNGCLDTVMQTATVYPLPVVDFTTGAVCLNQQNVFTNLSSISSGGIAQWFWDFGDAQTSGLQHPVHQFNAQGVYTVSLVAVSINQCSDSISKQVTVFDKPVAAFNINEVCEGGVSVFTDNSAITSGNIVAWNYLFGDGNATQQQSPSYTYSSYGSYPAVLVVVSDNGCSDTVQHAAVVHPLPIVSFSAPSVCLSNATAFVNTTSIATGTVSVWHWDFGNGDASSAQQPVHNYTSAGTYTVRLFATSDRGCSDSLFATLQIFQLPTVTATSTPACYNEADGTVLATAQSGTPPYNFLWSTGNQTSQVQQLFAGVYSVTVTDANNCTASATETLTQPSGPLTVNVTPAFPEINLGDMLTITLQNSYNQTNTVYSISPVTGLGCSTCAQFEAYPYQTTNYVVFVTDENGCTGEGEFTILVDESVPVFIPNAFSPNGDGQNDVWGIYSRAIKYVRISVYNRWGEKVFETENMNSMWDGTYMGEKVNPGVYVYEGELIFLNNRRQQVKGSVTVIR
ncbi:MAG: PKD domain-containing protein [Chitinophagales bacterium]|nr:PKD domain-containing protein [Chitinophagales bacterium]